MSLAVNMLGKQLKNTVTENFAHIYHDEAMLNKAYREVFSILVLPALLWLSKCPNSRQGNETFR